MATIYYSSADDMRPVFFPRVHEVHPTLWSDWTTNTYPAGGFYTPAAIALCQPHCNPFVSFVGASVLNKMLSYGTPFRSDTGADEFLHHKPRQYKRDSGFDRNTYASPLSNLGKAINVLSKDRNKLQRRFTDEHRVAHHTVDGVGYSPGSAATLVSQPSLVFHGREIPRWGGNLLNRFGPTIGTFSGPTVTLSGYMFLQDVIDVVMSEYYENGISYTNNWGGGFTQKIEVTELEWTIDKLYVEWSDELTKNGSAATNYSRSYNRMVTVMDYTYKHVAHSAGQPVDAQDGPNGNAYWRYSEGSCAIDIRTSVVEDGGNISPYSRFKTGQVRGIRRFGGYPERTLPHSPQRPQWVKDTYVSELRKIDKFYRRHLPLIYPSAYVSAASAIDSHVNETSQNMVEAAAEFSELLTLYKGVTDIKKFLDAIPMASWLSRGLMLADLAASTYLWYKFGVQPTIELVKFARDLDGIVGRLERKLFYNVELRGKMTYTFDDDDPIWGGFKLSTRSKVVMTFPESAGRMALLNMQGLGAEPSFSNIHATFPLSWLTDFATNNTRRWELAEAAIHAALASLHYTVHSHLLEIPMEQLLQRHNLPLLENHFTWDPQTSYRIYLRIPSEYFPRVPRDSGYDWLAPDRLPPWKILSSVTWNFFRS